jgi:hypothetical protein
MIEQEHSSIIIRDESVNSAMEILSQVNTPPLLSERKPKTKKAPIVSRIINEDNISFDSSESDQYSKKDEPIIGNFL